MKDPGRPLHPAVLAGLADFDRDEYAAAAARWTAGAVPGEAEAELLAALAALARAGGAAAAGDLAALLLLLGGTFAVLRWTPARELVRPERFLALLESAGDHWWMPAFLLLLYALLCPLGVPATPLLFAGGAIFGIVQGTAWNVLGTLLGATTTYFVARSLGREAVERLGGSRLARAERMLHKHGFSALVGLRFLPIPFPFVNAAAAVAGIRFPMFLASSAVGLTPAVAIWTYFSSALVRSAAADRARLARDLAIAIALLVSLVMIPTAVRLSRRRRRLASFRRARERRLAAERRAD